MGYKYIIPVTPEDKLELANAYAKVFKTGESTKEDREAVFVDIISFSGYLAVKPDGINLERSEGARSVGGLIFSMVNMSENERNNLYEASREKDIKEQTYG